MVSLQAALAAMALSGFGQTVLLDFYADWCGPCRAMNPTVEALVAAGYPVQRVNVDQNRPLATKYGVQSIPCFVMVVDGREVDRVTGGTTFSRLERMCKAGAAAASPPQSPSMIAQNSPPFARPVPPSLPKPSASVNWRSSPPAANQPASMSTHVAAGVSDAALIAASVRLRIEDPDGHSCGSGTIIDSRDGEALVLTCGHIFRDSQGKGPIAIDLFGANSPRQAPGRLISYDLDRDVGLVAIRTPFPVATARLAPLGYRVERGRPVVSVGCNNGGQPTARHSQVASLDKFLGPPTIQVAGQPVEGRSGGGLFSSEGYLIGVCNAADPSDKEGLFAALDSIHAELNQAQLAFVYNSSSENLAAAPARATAIAAAAAAPMPGRMPGPADLAKLSSMPVSTAEAPASLSSREQAALDEIRRRLKGGAEVICVIRPRGNPQAHSEVIMLDRASPDFLEWLAAEKRSQQGPRLTSLELPKPRKVLLEWSAPGGVPVRNPHAQQ